jgi:hypothetical protein
MQDVFRMSAAAASLDAAAPFVRITEVGIVCTQSCASVAATLLLPMLSFVSFCVCLQDMACDTFLKISNKCKRKFVVLQLQEQQPFVAELLDNLTATIQDLQPHQIHSFFESVGLMIGAEGEAGTEKDESCWSGRGG